MEAPRAERRRATATARKKAILRDKRDLRRLSRGTRAMALQEGTAAARTSRSGFSRGEIPRKAKLAETGERGGEV